MLLCTTAGIQVFKHIRIAGHFHGAGCTLAAAIAARLAVGEEIEVALNNAQTYVAQTLWNATAVGQGRWVPRRIAPGAA